MPRRRLTAGRKLDVLEMWELVFAWGGQCRGAEVHGYAIHRPACNGIGCWSRFESDEERRIAWFANRDDLIHSINTGFRPPA